MDNARFLSSSLSSYREDAIIVARDLQYPEDVIEDIKNATSESEIVRILHTARSGGGK